MDKSAHADAIKTALAEAVSSGKIFDRNSWDMCDSEEAIKQGKGYQSDIFLRLYPIMHFNVQVGVLIALLAIMGCLCKFFIILLPCHNLSSVYAPFIFSINPMKRHMKGDSISV